MVTERLAYDPWGKRLGASGTSDTTDSLVGLSTDRGYTEHEHLDEVGVIHMNGRIFDPYIGRFMSADPFIQAPFELQSHNRYAYVMNNPLAFTDPSGYWGLGSLIRTAIVIYVAYQTGGAISNYMMGTNLTAGAAMAAATTGVNASIYTAAAAGASSGFAAGFTASAMNGGNLEQSMKAGTMGAIVGYGVRGFDVAGRTAAKTLSSGAIAKAQGGSFDDAVRRTLLTTTAAEAYTRFVGWAATAEGGANQPNGTAECGNEGASCYNFTKEERIPPSWANKNVTGFNEPIASDDPWYSGKQGSPISRFFNAIPGVNATAMLHDTIWPPTASAYFNPLTNVLSMIPAAAISYGALIDKVPAMDKSKCPKCSK